MPELTGRNAIVTGGSRGLGLEIARRFLEAGLSGLAICAREEAVLLAATDELSRLAGSGQLVVGIPADVSRPEGAEEVCRRALEAFGQIHILVNNAGVYGPMGRLEEVDFEEWQATMAINVLGPAMMCRRLLPHFRAHKYGKIIQLSGGGATSPMPNFTAYAASKTAVVRLMESLDREAAADGIEVNCLAPGLLDTRLLDQVLEAGPGKAGEAYYQRMLEAKRSGKTVSPSLAADLAVFLASDAGRGIRGKLVSAQWDRYRDWPDHVEELAASDAYTLRRIVGRDRKMEWGDV